MIPIAPTLGEAPMVPKGSYFDDLPGRSTRNSSSSLGNHLAGSAGSSSMYLDDQLDGSKGNPSMGPGGLPHEPGTAASDHRRVVCRAGSGGKRSATLVPVRLFSKAAIYPYASQGLSCQGADSTLLATAAYGAQHTAWTSVVCPNQMLLRYWFL
jgi:hypothetical protein